MFVGLHAILAAQTNTPELAISEQEGKDFTKAAQNVMRHYSVQTTQKTLDWISFAGVCAGMYGTRFLAISVRKKMERGAKSEPRGQVLDFPSQRRKREPDAAPAQTVEPPPFVPSVHDGGYDPEAGGF